MTMTHDPQEIYDALCAPFGSEEIDWRIGSTNKDKTQGMALAYLDARAVMDRLDRVCGPDGWQCNYSHGLNGSIVCNLAVRFGEHWVWKADGAGETDFEAEKGALSDAFKRAAVRFGIGRYLYDLDAPWIPIENGKYIPKGERKRLDEIHEDFAAKAGWGPRSGIQVYRLLKKVAQEFVTDCAAAQEFKDKNKSEISQLPVAMRRHLFDLLDRIGADTQEAA